jgi:hypothetical protein
MINTKKILSFILLTALMITTLPPMAAIPASAGACANCGGTGRVVCGMCSGTGISYTCPDPDCDYYGSVHNSYWAYHTEKMQKCGCGKTLVEETCSQTGGHYDCKDDGTGTYKEKCSTCSGTGEISCCDGKCYTCHCINCTFTENYGDCCHPCSLGNHIWVYCPNHDHGQDNGGHHYCSVCESNGNGNSSSCYDGDDGGKCDYCGHNMNPAEPPETVATPTSLPNGGTFAASQSVTISCTTAGAKIYYTLDGSTPTTGSTLYTGAFTLTETTTVKAIAIKNEMTNSNVFTVTFTKDTSGNNPDPDPLPGPIPGPLTPTTTEPTTKPETTTEEPATKPTEPDDDNITDLVGGSTVKTPDGKKPVTDKNGNAKLSGGGTVKTPGKFDIDVPSGTVIDKDGKITFPKNSGGAKVTLDNGFTFNIGENAEIILDAAAPLGYIVLVHNPFSDVKKSDWFYDDVMFAYSHGLMIGTGKESFSPNATLTGGMVVTILYRLAGESDVSDVSGDAWYANAVKWAADNGIIDGDNFKPKDNIARQDFAVILYLFQQVTGKIPMDKVMDREFIDWDKIDDSSKNAVNVLTTQGIINGYEDGSFRPQGHATRAEFAAMMRRFIINS